MNSNKSDVEGLGFVVRAYGIVVGLLDESGSSGRSGWLAPADRWPRTGQACHAWLVVPLTLYIPPWL